MPENHFDLRQAEELLPEIEVLLTAALECKKLLDEASRAQARTIERVVRMGGSRVNLSEALALKKRKEKLLDSLREHIELVQDYGVLIKDLEIGLIDFPTQIRGKDAYICWKLGETSIRHWHYTDEGFSNRKPLDEKLVQISQRRANQ
jgi:hypothetical protein